MGRVEAVTTNTQRYDIAVIGTGPQRTGLLKSLDERGQWQGSVYTVPFRSAITLATVRGNTRRQPDGGIQMSYPLGDFDVGQQFHLTWAGTGPADGTVTLEVQREGTPLPGFATTLPCSADAPRQYRVVLRNQLPADGLEVIVNLPPGFDLTASEEAHVITERLARLHRGDETGNAHQGSIDFAVIPGP